MSDVIEGAIGLLETRGWCRHYLEDEEGRLCALGALVTAKEEQGASDAAFVAAYSAVCEAIGVELISVWNNFQVEGVDEVIAKLREADELLASRAAA